MRRLVALLGALLVLAGARPALASCNIVIQNVDPTGVGFNDPTAVAPVGGNAGATVGQQRLIVFQQAAAIWEGLLDSSVDILLQASFAPLACDANSGVLGSAGPSSSVVLQSVPGKPDNLWYPQALAERLLTTNDNGTQPDIVAQFNGALDSAGCLDGSQWYYGLDAAPPTGGIDLLAVVLHELGHGLGFLNLVDDQTGALPSGRADVFTTSMLDTTTGKHWHEMTDAERLASSVNVRHLSWDGAEAWIAVPEQLDSGAPILAFDPPLSGFSGYLGEATFTPPVSATLTAAVTRPTERSGCNPMASQAGVFVLVDRGGCTFSTKVKNAETAGAIAVIVADNAPGSPPASMDADGGPSSAIPAVRITQADGELLHAALDAHAVTAVLSADPTRLVGADEHQRPLLAALDPIDPGSSTSHWDTLARPNQLLEPYLSDGQQHDVGLALEVMHDIGWFPLDCGNDTLDAGEECDDGNLVPGDGCTAACRAEQCGDGVLNGGEAETCDDGIRNSDALPNACRTDCQLPHCGDSVLDDGEQCDDGNADGGDGCGSTCQTEFCGDGIVNDGPSETCDDGAANSDTTPNACRTDCQPHRCGDGVVDDAEQCDDGNRVPGDGCDADCHVESSGAGGTTAAGGATGSPSSGASGGAPTTGGGAGPSGAGTAQIAGGGASSSGDSTPPIGSDAGASPAGAGGTGNASCSCSTVDQPTSPRSLGLGVWLLGLLAVRRRRRVNDATDTRGGSARGSARGTSRGESRA